MIRENTPRWENFFLQGWHPYFWILFLGVLVYFQVIFFDFIPLDDRLLIVDTHDFLSNFKNVFQAFKQDFFKVAEQASSKIYYRPMVTISLMLDAWISGVSPFVYHLSNLVFHLLASCLLFIFLKKWKWQRNLRSSFQSFSRFIRHPKERGAHNALGVIYANKRMYKEAEKHFHYEFSNYPDSVDSLVNLARLKYQQNEFKTAEELFRSVYCCYCYF